jgi:tetratricopeptide (TPR) repeat protein
MMQNLLSRSKKALLKAMQCNKYIVYVAFFYLVLGIGHTDTIFAKTSREIGSIAESVTVKINKRLLSGGGSGVIFDKQGDVYFVLTAYHVVKGKDGAEAYTISVGRKEKEYQVLSVQRLDEQVNGVDVAVVTFRSNVSYPNVSFGNSENLQIGSQIYVSGFPAVSGNISTDREFAFQKGLISGKPNRYSQGYALQHDASTAGGMSGGPIFDDDGKLVALHGRGAGNENEFGGTVIKVQGFNYGIPTGLFFNSPLLRQVKLAEAVPNTSIFPNINNPQTYEDWMAKAYTCEEKRDFICANNAYVSANKIDPSNAAPEIGIARITNDPIQVKVAIGNAARISPNCSNLVNRGNISFSEGNFNSAIADYSEAIKSDFQCLRAYHNRAVTYRNLMKGKSPVEVRPLTEAALNDIDQIVKQAPSFDAFYNRALLRYGVRDQNGAISDFKEAIRINPNNIEAYVQGAFVVRRNGELMCAINLLSKAISIDSNRPEPIYNRGLYKRDAGDLRGAYEDLTQAEAMFSRSSDLQPLYEKARYARTQLQSRIQSGEISSFDVKPCLSSD